MKKYRLSKYDPSWRDASGVYLRDDWTAVSDIGRYHAGVMLTAADYRRVEDSYVRAILAFATAASTGLGLGSMDGPDGSLWTGGMRPEDLRIIQESVDARQRSGTPGGLVPVGFDLASIARTERLTAAEVDAVSRLALREFLSCDLVGDSGFKVFFGYDLLVGISGPDSCTRALAEIAEMGLFVEETGRPPVR